MRKRFIQILVSGLWLVWGTSCQEVLEPTPYTFTQLFTGLKSKTWGLTLVEETLEGKVIGRFPVECAADDEYIFYASSDRLFEIKSGSQRCFEDEPDTTTDTWSFNNATATLTMVLPIFSSGRLPFIVRKIDKDDLTLEIFFDEEGTASYRIYFKQTDEE